MFLWPPTLYHCSLKSWWLIILLLLASSMCNMYVLSISGLIFCIPGLCLTYTEQKRGQRSRNRFLEFLLRFLRWHSSFIASLGHVCLSGKHRVDYKSQGTISLCLVGTFAVMIIYLGYEVNKTWDIQSRAELNRLGTYRYPNNLIRKASGLLPVLVPKKFYFTLID